MPKNNKLSVDQALVGLDDKNPSVDVANWRTYIYECRSGIVLIALSYPIYYLLIKNVLVSFFLDLIIYTVFVYVKEMK